MKKLVLHQTTTNVFYIAIEEMHSFMNWNFRIWFSPFRKADITNESFWKFIQNISSRYCSLSSTFHVALVVECSSQFYIVLSCPPEWIGACTVGKKNCVQLKHSLRFGTSVQLTGSGSVQCGVWFYENYNLHSVDQIFKSIHEIL